MRITPIIATGLLVLCGCNGHEQSSLEPIAESLSETWPRANLDLELILRAREINGKIILHCVLRNTSDAALTINGSRLPWTSPTRLSVYAVGANGKVPLRPPPPVQISVLEAAPNPIVISQGEILEGDVELTSGPILPIGDLPRDLDILLMWSYWLDISTPGENPFFSGLTFIGRRA
jgi:hypothetical protein